MGPENAEARDRNVPTQNCSNWCCNNAESAAWSMVNSNREWYNNINSLSCMENNLKEVDRFIGVIEKLRERSKT